MKLDIKEDIEAPIEFVFGQVSDFRAIERAAMRRGAEVQRVDRLSTDGPGMVWEASFELHGKRRDLRLELIEHAPPERLVVMANSPGLGGEMTVDLLALAPAHTRLHVQIDLAPRTLSSKLLVQSLKLARKNLMKRIEARMTGLAEEIGRRYRQSA